MWFYVFLLNAMFLKNRKNEPYLLIAGAGNTLTSIWKRIQRGILLCFERK
jgi:hypothetical protein